MISGKLKFSALAGLCALLLLLTVSVRHAIAWNPVMNRDLPAPDFIATDVKGNTVTLSDFRGKPVLLNFWATWCPYCRKERAHLNTLHKEYSARGLIILSVSTDSSIARVRSFLKSEPAEFTVLTDSSGAVSSLYNVRGLPSSYLISRDGHISQTLVGYRDWSEPAARSMIEEVLSN